MPDLPDVLQLAAITVILCVPILAITMGRPLGRALAERLKHRTAAEDSLETLRTLRELEARLSARLDRLEQHADASGVEIERLGESHRYVAKLLAARESMMLPPSTKQPTPLPTRTPSDGTGKARHAAT